MAELSRRKVIGDLEQAVRALYDQAAALQAAGRRREAAGLGLKAVEVATQVAAGHADPDILAKVVFLLRDLSTLLPTDTNAHANEAVEVARTAVVICRPLVEGRSDRRRVVPGERGGGHAGRAVQVSGSSAVRRGTFRGVPAADRLAGSTEWPTGRPPTRKPA